jgi:hypothetical protein
VEKVVEKVNVNEAQASVEADLVRIRAQIDESVGTDGFHAALQQKLMAALSLTVVHAPRRLLVRSAREEEGKSEQNTQQQTDGVGEVHATCSGITIQQ